MKRRNFTAGQSLIEVLLAAAVVGIALTALVSIVTASVARNREAKERAVATRLAQEVVESMRVARDYNSWDLVYPQLETIDTGSDGYLFICVDESVTNGPTDYLSMFPSGADIWTGTSYSLTQAQAAVRSCAQSYTDYPTVGFNRGAYIDLVDEAGPEEWMDYVVIVDWPVSGGRYDYVELHGRIK